VQATVGSVEWGFAVWSHNANYGKPVEPNHPASISRKAAEYRQDNNTYGYDGNVAVIKYKTQGGNFKYTYGQAQKKLPHAEKQAWSRLPKYVQENPGKYVQLLYTERGPCEGCSNALQGDGKGHKIPMAYLAESKVRWSFDYYTGQEDFEKYISGLKKANKK
jgi:Xanthomonas XOO_2897-like deaminase